MELECKSCGYEWDYQGESDYYATCPNCHYKVKVNAEAEVVSPEVEISRFDEEENRFVKELASCEGEEDLKEVCKKYDQEEFNSIKKRIKEKANKIREDLRRYERVEDTLESVNWEYPDL
ncbi:MAG: hypothetical protein KGY76_06275 [Candidatus Thermoplasmatota archaeon]|nr:hypothetical protein [Candidatus Thermoplasmatota archaeon]